MACVYFHINPLKNEIFYVGIGTHEKRAYAKCGRNRLWNNVVNKYGYIIDIAHKNIDIETAKEYEINYIKRLGRVNLKNGKLVNMTDGGDGSNNMIVSKETREKLSKAGLGKSKNEDWKRKLGLKKIGKNRSKELKDTLSKYFSENPSTPKKSVDLLGMNGNYIKTFVGIKEAAREMGLCSGAISKCCNNVPKYKSVHKTKWRFTPK